MEQHKVVTLSCHRADYSYDDNCYIRNNDNHSLQLDLIGNRDTLSTLASIINKNLMKQEKMLEGIGRFELCDSKDNFIVSVDVPILSDLMLLINPNNPSESIPFQFYEDCELLFYTAAEKRMVFYIRFENFLPPSYGIDESLYPKLNFLNAQDSPVKENSLSIDSIFPALTGVFLDAESGAMILGSPSDEFHGGVEAGLTQNGDQAFAPVQFTLFENFLLCLEAAMAKQQLLAEEMEPKVRIGWTNIIIFPPEMESALSADRRLIKSTIQTCERVQSFYEMSKGHLSYEYPSFDFPTSEELYMMMGPIDLLQKASLEELESQRQTLRDKGFVFNEVFPCIDRTLNKPNKGHYWFKMHNRRLLVAKDADPGKNLFQATVQSLFLRTTCCIILKQLVHL